MCALLPAFSEYEHIKLSNMKHIIISCLALLMFSCVSTKKYDTLNTNYKKLLEENKACDTQVKNLQETNTTLSNRNQTLTDEVDYLKKTGGQILSTLQDMSVLSGKQAESMKQSLQSLSEKEAYIKDLQSAINRKDSLNMALVMNLKSSLGNVNDEDVNIKVEKGVVYIDLSDKMLFYSGSYNVTSKAKTVLGKIAKVLDAHPELDVMVEGHTDSVPIRNDVVADNWDLSVKRATSVIRILQQEYKIDPLRMVAAGHGKYDPIATNETVDGRAQNRRTRIIILPQLDQFFKLLVRD